MHETALVNPFNTETIFWIDAGYFRRPDGHAPIRRPLVRNNITKNGAGAHQFVSYRVNDRNQIAAGSFGGTMEAMPAIYDRYFETFWFMTVRNMCCIGIEQLVMKLMCESFPDLCCIQNAGDEWFMMGDRYLPSRTQLWNNTFVYEPGDQELVKLPVIFPTDHVIVSSRNVSYEYNNVSYNNTSHT